MMDTGSQTIIPPDQIESMIVVLDLLRASSAQTKPELVDSSGLGRTVVTQRLAYLYSLGLAHNVGFGPSTGGRAPRAINFNTKAGYLLVAELGATEILCGVASLDGEVIRWTSEQRNIAKGPDPTLTRVEQMLDALLVDLGLQSDRVWGVGVGIPAPVEFATGRPAGSAIMPGWDGYPVRQRLSARFNAPAWVDNDVNLMALGELRAGLARADSDVVYIKVGSGVGAGVISNGTLQRGAQGLAGDIAHVCADYASTIQCKCGNLGCLEAVAGAVALTTEAALRASAGESDLLFAKLNVGGDGITLADLVEASEHGDAVSLDLLAVSARYVGAVLATLVNFQNPSLVILGGSVARSGPGYLARVREEVMRRALPLATKDLRITMSSLNDLAGLEGAAHMVIDELFSAASVAKWVATGSPHGATQLFVASD